ncbi:MAG: hypothetical protein N3D20_02000 [Candidatus Pacearchaeota archaeon]|nr:hypothetical protein [Candidatus Pacearchaeota archaeon]
MEQNENSYIRQLVDYLKKNLRKGYTKESLKWALVNQGHSKIQVEKAMRMVDTELAMQAPVLETKPQIKVEVIKEENENKEEKPSFWKRIFGFGK